MMNVNFPIYKNPDFNLGERHLGFMFLCRRKDIGDQEIHSIADDPRRTLWEWERSQENDVWDSVMSGLMHSG